ncbi:hypothetical protein A6X21_02685 [Planctopirus hydrillae]|uniref:Uncharacterized protein n=1 Tax=Planctopirus hydrillae TaxID=1841610 RepID=A0A1C3EMY6_9PLAN|nr:hypothetical protein A6X21_02685 [Planctopirus hydrillae]
MIEAQAGSVRLIDVQFLFFEQDIQPQTSEQGSCRSSIHTIMQKMCQTSFPIRAEATSPCLIRLEEQ